MKYLIPIFLCLIACSPNEGTAVDVTTGEIKGTKEPILRVKDSFTISGSSEMRSIVVDTETGVEYIVITTGNGITMVPRIGRCTPNIRAEKETK